MVTPCCASVGLQSQSAKRPMEQQKALNAVGEHTERLLFLRQVSVNQPNVFFFKVLFILHAVFFQHV